jgi:cytoskeletal protein RodZ
MSRLSSAPLLFGISTVLIVGLLFGGLWYAGKYNDDQAHASVAVQSDGHSSQVLPGDEQPAAPKEPAKSDSHAQTTAPTPSKPTTPTPTPKTAPTPTPAPLKQPSPAPTTIAVAGPTSIPSTGTSAAELGLSGVMITLVTFLAMRLRTQRTQLRALR